MRGRLVTLIAVNGGTDFLVTGWKADEVIEGAGIGAVWSRLHGGWLLYSRNVADLMAYAQVRGVAVRGITREAARELREEWATPGEELFTAVNSPETEKELSNALDSSEQLDLFGGGA